MCGEEDRIDDDRGDCHVADDGLGNEEGRDPRGKGSGERANDDARSDSPPRERAKQGAQLRAIARTDSESDQSLRGDSKGVEKEERDLPGRHDDLIGREAVDADRRRAPDRGEEGQANRDRARQERAADARGLADSCQ